MAANNRSRSVTITQANAKFTTDKELRETVQMTANALEGTHGDGDWDGGIEGATGFFYRYAKFWNAKIVYEIHGSNSLVFPFTLVDAVVRITNAATGATTSTFVDRSRTMAISGDGKYVLEVSFVKNVKEA